MELMRPRWKGKAFAGIAAANPISKLVSQLQTSLIQSNAHAILTDCNALLQASQESADLLDRACFGRRTTASYKQEEEDKQWFQLGFEEAFYLHHSLQCLTIVAGEDERRPLEGTELWEQMRSKKEAFPELYMAYAHLRAKNWVVRSGTQYGVDFVAYRHHPALVHSEYAVLVLTEDRAAGSSSSGSPRLKVWSDLQSSVRVCGSVAKTLLVLYVEKDGGDNMHPTCLQKFRVEERALRRWMAEQSREGETSTQN